MRRRAEGPSLISAGCKRHVQTNRGCFAFENQVYRPMIPAFIPASQTHGVNHKSDLDDNLIIDAHPSNRLVQYT
jgi:hypothetical protein